MCDKSAEIVLKRVNRVFIYVKRFKNYTNVWYNNKAAEKNHINLEKIVIKITQRVRAVLDQSD